MSERPPAPAGYKYNWLGQLREDPDYYPPPGYRLTRNFITNRLELAALYGPGVNWFSDGNQIKKPNYGPHSRNYSFAVPDPERIGEGIRSVGPAPDTDPR